MREGIGGEKVLKRMKMTSNTVQRMGMVLEVLGARGARARRAERREEEMRR